MVPYYQANHSSPPVLSSVFAYTELPPSVSPSSLWQVGGRAGEAAEQQPVSRYHSVFYSLLEYNLTLGTKWYSPVTL